MKQNINIEAEGNELVLKNKANDYVIIPKKYRKEVQDMIKEGCHGCIDALVETLPVMEDYAQDGSLYPEEPSINPNNPIKLPEVTITAEAPTYIKYRRAWAKENPFDIDKYVEDRFNNPVGREAIKRINEKAWKETLKQEGLKKRQAELNEATKMGLLYQRFNPQGKDDMPIADEQFQKRYGTSPHRYRYDNDPEYRKYYEQQGRNATSTIDYPSTDLRRKDVVAPNNMWMYPNLTGENKRAMTDFSYEAMETALELALPIPGLEAMGKIPSIFKAGKNLIKPVSKVVNKTDDAIKTFDNMTQIESVKSRADRLLNQKQKWNNPNDEFLEMRLKFADKSHYPTLTTDEYNKIYGSNFTPKNLGVNNEMSTSVFYDAPLSKANKNRIAAHETGHWYQNTFDEGVEWNRFFDFSKESYKTQRYLKGRGVTRGDATGSGVMGDEITQRAAQLKDFIAEKWKIPLDRDFVITETQFDYALKNYVKETGLDNSMTAFINAIIDKKGLLKHMNKKALALPPVLGAKTAIESQNQNKTEQ